MLILRRDQFNNHRNTKSNHSRFLPEALIEQFVKAGLLTCTLLLVFPSR